MNIFIFLLIYFLISTLNTTRAIEDKNNLNQTSSINKFYTNLKKGTSCKSTVRITSSIKSLSELNASERKTRHKTKIQTKYQKNQRSTLKKEQNSNLKKDQISPKDNENIMKKVADLQTNLPKTVFKKQIIPCAFSQEEIKDIFTEIKKEDKNISQYSDISFSILCNTETNSNKFIGLVYDLFGNEPEKNNLTNTLVNLNKNIKENNLEQVNEKEQIKKLLDLFTIYKDADIKKANIELNKILDNLKFNFRVNNLLKNNVDRLYLIEIFL
uniref:Uncharacterized protein n=1 Tax=Meloidogyne enterolobii TaxID=390850 RepID=A0A6V7UDK7_MELEN|nr:unnamed protein product [Meloidogyne enterolobii]